VHELKETDTEQQFVPRDAAVRAQPEAQQRARALDGVDVDFAEPVTIVVARILTMSAADCRVPIAPGWQSGMDVVFIGMGQRAGCNRLRDDRLGGCLLHVWQHRQDHRSAAPDQRGHRRFLLRQRAACRRTREPAMPPSRATSARASRPWRRYSVMPVADDRSAAAARTAHTIRPAILTPKVEALGLVEQTREAAHPWPYPTWMRGLLEPTGSALHLIRSEIWPRRAPARATTHDQTGASSH
jgi:hypothetical protein